LKVIIAVKLEKLSIIAVSSLSISNNFAFDLFNNYFKQVSGWQTISKFKLLQLNVTGQTIKGRILGPYA